MLRFLAFGFAFVAALSLAACGQNDGGGPAETAVSAEHAKAVAIIPAFVPLYPDASVYSSIGSEATGTVIFSTQADGEAVIAFYRGKAEEAGMEEALDEDDADVGTMTFSALKGEAGMKVIAAPGTGVTNVQLVWQSRALGP